MGNYYGCEESKATPDYKKEWTENNYFNFYRTKASKGKDNSYHDGEKLYCLE
jgi:hypothetical protein